MTDAAAVDATSTTEDTTASTAADAPKPTETVEFWKEKAREQEKRAKSNAEAAKRLAEIEDAQKTEAQKTAEKLAELQTQLAAAEAKALRSSIAARHGIPPEDAELLLTGTDEETLTAQAERLAQTLGKPKPAPRSPQEGKGGDPKASDNDTVREFARDFFQN
jgi:hypothetical protein